MTQKTDDSIKAEGDPKPEQGDTPPQDTPKTFTQADMDAMAARARQEERGKYPDYAKLKADSDKLANLEHEKLSEADRLREEKAAAEKMAAEATARLTESTVANEIKLRAYQKGIVDPDAALALVDRSGISHDAATGVTGVDEALDALMGAKPWLKAPSGAPNLNPGGNDLAPAPVVLTAEQRTAADAMGISHEDYAKNLQVRR